MAIDPECWTDEYSPEEWWDMLGPAADPQGPLIDRMTEADLDVVMPRGGYPEDKANRPADARALPALAAWWRRDGQKPQGQWRHDALWQAACWESAAAHLYGVDSAACLAHARRVTE